MVIHVAAFIIWIESFSLVKGIQVTVFTPGWRGIVPSLFIVGIILSAVTSACSVLFSVWF
jgi:hypothetical protein